MMMSEIKNSSTTLDVSLDHAATDGLDYSKTPNCYVTVHGTKLTYRTIEHRSDAPTLVLFQHFTGTMDDWDQSMIEELAKNRSLVLFENARIGASEGKTPDSVATMAHYAEGFLDALHLSKVDVLGFSLSGAVAQQVWQTALS
jgi:pimeloyl-ACP methyl ester carboxylesterase